jgi:hypothetical protein
LENAKGDHECENGCRQMQMMTIDVRGKNAGVWSDVEECKGGNEEALIRNRHWNKQSKSQTE